MRLLADENMAPEVVEALRSNGHDVRSVMEEAPGMKDREVMQWAVADHRILVTHDRDFGNVLYFPVQEHAGIILLRLKNQAPPNVVRCLLRMFTSNDEAGFKNRLTICRETHTRFYPREA